MTDSSKTSHGSASTSGGLDPFAVLGVPRATATLDEVKRAFRDLAKEYHPDRVRAVALGAGQETPSPDAIAASEMKFNELQQAMDLIDTQDKLDKIRSEAVVHVPFSSSSLDKHHLDVLSEPIPTAREHAEQKKVHDIESLASELQEMEPDVSQLATSTVCVTLDEIETGCDKTVIVAACASNCEVCADQEEMPICSECNGAGSVTVKMHSLSPGAYPSRRTKTCGRCSGHKYLTNCDACKGLTRTFADREVVVKIAPGTHYGWIRIPGQGHASTRSPIRHSLLLHVRPVVAATTGAGDVKQQTVVAWPHIHRGKGDAVTAADLHVDDWPVQLSDALGGFRARTLQLPGGRTVLVDFDAGYVLQDGDVLLIPECGLPKWSVEEQKRQLSLHYNQTEKHHLVATDRKPLPAAARPAVDEAKFIGRDTTSETTVAAAVARGNLHIRIKIAMPQFADIQDRLDAIRAALTGVKH